MEPRKPRRFNIFSQLGTLIFLAFLFNRPLIQFVQGLAAQLGVPPLVVGAGLAVGVLVVMGVLQLVIDLGARGQASSPLPPSLPLPEERLPPVTRPPAVPVEPVQAPTPVLPDLEGMPETFASARRPQTVQRAPDQPMKLPPPPLPPATIDLQRGRLPGGAPRFEPVIDMRVLGAGISVVLLLGAAVAAFLALTGSWP